jgi:metallo-beta-lactamase class B
MRAVISLFATAVLAMAQENPGWRRPFSSHKIAGNLHYVGTEDLACFLFTTPAGHILVNTGLVDSTPLIRESISKLGFKIEDIRILLTTQAHFDHVAAMKEIQQISGAKVYATEADAPVLEDGGKSDPFLGAAFYFEPVKVDRRLKDGDVVALGGTELEVILTPGHTKGSVCYSTTIEDAGQKRNVLIANMGSVVMPLVGNSKYPNIAQDLAGSFEKQRKLTPDIWVAAHASQYGMAEKLKTGTFVDPKGYKDAVERYARMFHDQLKKEQGGRK